MNNRMSASTQADHDKNSELNTKPSRHITLLVGIAIMLLTLTVIVWRTYQLETSAVTVTPSTTTTQAETDQPLTLSENAPAPAKKLHQLVTDPNQQADASMQEQIQQVAADIEDIDSQLQQHGIVLPQPVSSQASTSTQSDSELKARLKAIQNHINKQETQP